MAGCRMRSVHMDEWVSGWTRRAVCVTDDSIMGKRGGAGVGVGDSSKQRHL